MKALATLSVFAVVAAIASAKGPAHSGAHFVAKRRAVGLLSWPPPALQHPVTIQVRQTDGTLFLSNDADYRIRMPRRPFRRPGGIVITGGHNVVLIGGAIQVDYRGKVPAAQSRRALLLRGQTGTVHVEGLHLGGRDLSEGIDLDERDGATVQLENIRIDRVRPRDTQHYSDTHSDLLQSWGGPKLLRVDRFSGQTAYQGMFLLPQQFDAGATTQLADLRHVDIDGTPSAHYLLWREPAFAVRLRSVLLASSGRSPGTAMWPDAQAWPGVHLAQRHDFVKGGTVGIGYRSPGYRKEATSP